MTRLILSIFFISGFWFLLTLRANASEPYLRNEYKPYKFNFIDSIKPDSIPILPLLEGSIYRKPDSLSVSFDQNGLSSENSLDDFQGNSPKSEVMKYLTENEEFDSLVNLKINLEEPLMNKMSQAIKEERIPRTLQNKRMRSVRRSISDQRAKLNENGHLSEQYRFMDSVSHLQNGFADTKKAQVKRFDKKTSYTEQSINLKDGREISDIDESLKATRFSKTYSKKNLSDSVSVLNQESKSVFNKDYEENSLEYLVRKRIDYRDYYGQELPDKSLVKNKVINKEYSDQGISSVLDSIDQVAKSGEQMVGSLKTELKEDTKENVKTFVYEKKEDIALPENTFIDVLFTINSVDKSFLNFAPSIGYKLGERVAVGAGIVFTNTSAKEYKVKTSIGIKGFVRYYVIVDRFYLHGEGTYFDSSISYLRSDKYKETPSQWGSLAGFGYQHQIWDRLGVNVQLLYNIKTTPDLPTNNSPIIFRVGLKIF